MCFAIYVYTIYIQPKRDGMTGNLWRVCGEVAVSVNNYYQYMYIFFLCRIKWASLMCFAQVVLVLYEKYSQPIYFYLKIKKKKVV